ncbi:uncharacterized protein LOC118509297 [Anopheles stephensi]|uniref:uncharacterized protein LOC118509297 n=1 Tax=Anopheles stephensi TaxID=30069 RepID=UPI0016588184|nr:uncharacterized protein LOC118509297 [Anopheles stephensi]XP_035905629.1 uncharacterized protein LOC118509297 [Anopheles stephensi]
MTSKSSLYRKRRLILEEEERIMREERDAMEASSSVSVPASGASGFATEPASEPMNLDVLYDSNTVSVDSVGGGIVGSSIDVNTNDIYDEVEEPAELRDDFWTEAYSFLNDFSTLKDALKYLAVAGHLSRSFLNLLLAILRKFGHPDLPKDARSLLKIPTVSNEIQTVASGRFWYPGIEVALRNVFKNSPPQVTNLSLQVSIDGLPLFKSSVTQFWPILFKVEEISDCPVMVAGVFSGQTKPGSLEQFLRPIVDEINNLRSTGIQFGDHVLPVCIKAFIADSPARAFIKSVMGFSGKHGCTKCTTVGVHVQPEGKVIFNPSPAPPRTDTSFRAREDKEHHKTIHTPLEDIEGLDMIKSFPVADRLHLLDLGGSRKFLQGFMNNKMVSFDRWTSDQKKNISHFLVKTKLPSEVHRPFRSLETIQYWKGTEFRSFLHYVSPVIYKDFMHEVGYNHYLLYFCSITIYSSSTHAHLHSLARRMLLKFVLDFPIHYGRTHMSSNIHNLLHVHEDVEVHGELDNFSAYPFENFLQFLKRCVRKGSKCLEQVAGRSKLFASMNVISSSNKNVYPCVTSDGCGLHITASFVLKPVFKDQWLLTTSNSIVKFVRVEISSQNIFIIHGIQYENNVDYFHVNIEDNVSRIELKSSEIGIYKLNSFLPSLPVTLTIESIKCKLVAVNLPPRPLVYFNVDEFVDDTPPLILFIPLLHSFNNN